MVVNTHFGSQASRQRRSLPEHIVQHNPNPGVRNNRQPPRFPPLGGGDRDRREGEPPE
jgi:hypothetical protein